MTIGSFHSATDNVCRGGPYGAPDNVAVNPSQLPRAQLQGCLTGGIFIWLCTQEDVIYIDQSCGRSGIDPVSSCTEAYNKQYQMIISKKPLKLFIEV